MDARQLEYFLAVVDEGGVSRAAQALRIAQPSLSQAIRTLERDLGSDLFHRVGRRVVLTPAGQALIEPARQVVRGIESARASVESTAGLQAGQVEIAAMPSQTVEPLSSLIGVFTRAYPGLSVGIRAAPTADVVLEMVRSGVTELGLLGTAVPVKAAGVRLEPAGVQRFVLISPPGSPFPDGGPVRREALRGCRLIVGQTGTGMRRLVDEIQADGIDVTAVVESEHREAFLPLVLGGVGYAVLTDSWATLARQAGATVSLLEPAAHLHLSLASRTTALTPAAEAFLKVARDNL